MAGQHGGLGWRRPPGLRLADDLRSSHRSGRPALPAPVPERFRRRIVKEGECERPVGVSSLALSSLWPSPARQRRCGEQHATNGQRGGNAGAELRRRCWAVRTRGSRLRRCDDEQAHTIAAKVLMVPLPPKLQADNHAGCSLSTAITPLATIVFSASELFRVEFHQGRNCWGT